jgi:hypothetical protein
MDRTTCKYHCSSIDNEWRNVEIENQLREVSQKITQKEAQISSLTEKLASIESSEKLAGMNEALKGPISCCHWRRVQKQAWLCCFDSTLPFH